MQRSWGRRVLGGVEEEEPGAGVSKEARDRQVVKGRGTQRREANRTLGSGSVASTWERWQPHGTWLRGTT